MNATSPAGRAARPGDAETVGWLTRAARETAATSPDVAADLLERALSLMEPRDPQRDQLLAERAGSLMLAGRIAQAVTVCRSMLGRHHDKRVDGPVSRLARVHVHCGRLSAKAATFGAGWVRPAGYRAIAQSQPPAPQAAQVPVS